MLSGNKLPETARPISQAYAGHQFGGFSPRLGDGRAILLGELAGKDIQLKGSGRTPFSRGGDGKSALGPVIREYLVSEAMHALGVPTTRALAAVTTGEKVLRQEGPLPGGVFTRVATSHIRVGTFQYFRAQNDTEALKILADYTMARHYPNATDYEDFLTQAISHQASLIAHWMSLGFIHGVMNTDNCAVSGETIDYGPCAFMDEFHPGCVFSSIDRGARYSWENQARIAHWNLTRLAETLLPLLRPDMDEAIKVAEPLLEDFVPQFKANYLERFQAKLGAEVPEEFLSKTLGLMANEKLDFTIFFCELTRLTEGRESEYFEPHKKWLREWHELGTKDVEAMKKANPVLIPRNHRVEEAIQAAYQGDYAIFHQLVEAWQTPFEDNAELEKPPTESQKVRETFCGT